MSKTPGLSSSPAQVSSGGVSTRKWHGELASDAANAWDVLARCHGSAPGVWTDKHSPCPSCLPAKSWAPENAFTEVARASFDEKSRWNNGGRRCELKPDRPTFESWRRKKETMAGGPLPAAAEGQHIQNGLPERLQVDEQWWEAFPTVDKHNQHWWPFLGAVGMVDLARDEVNIGCKPSFQPLKCADISPTVCLGEDICSVVTKDEEYFAMHGLIGRFRGYWPSLATLHQWITNTWRPILEGHVEIYPCARGFFVVAFNDIKDKNAILYDHQWSYEHHLLMLKLWHPSFNPTIESFDAAPIWVRFLNLSLQFWLDFYFEAIGNVLGKFLGVDEGSLNYLHTIYARILVDLDTSKDLLANISLKTAAGCWNQLLDYEVLPFCSRRCFNMGYIAAHCAK